MKRSHGVIAVIVACGIAALASRSNACESCQAYGRGAVPCHSADPNCGLLDVLDAAVGRFQWNLARAAQSSRAACDRCRESSCGCEIQPTCGVELRPTCGVELQPTCGVEIEPSCGCERAGCGCSGSTSPNWGAASRRGAPVSPPMYYTDAPSAPAFAPAPAPPTFQPQRPSAAPTPIPLPRAVPDRVPLPDAAVDPFRDDSASRLRQSPVQSVQYGAVNRYRGGYDPQARATAHSRLSDMPSNGAGTRRISSDSPVVTASAGAPERLPASAAKPLTPRTAAPAPTFDYYANPLRGE